MKKQIMFLFVCFSLIMPGSSFITGLNAQTKGKRTARTPNSQGKSQKIPSPLKNPSIQKILRDRKAGNLNIGDPCLEAAPITLGQTLSGELAATDCMLDDGTFIDFYVFNGTSGQAISVSQNSAVIDTFLILFDDAGEVIDLNDDSGEDTNSRIPADAGAVTLPYTGQYIIGANSFDAAEFGAYTVSLNSDPSCVATPIAYNQTVNGTLSESDCAVSGAFFSDLYSFNGVAGQQISIAQNSTAVDSFLVLHMPSETIFDDDGGGAPNSRIPASGLFTLPETGTYIIEASAFDAFEVGAYTLILTGPTVVVPTARKYFDYDGDGKADVSVFRPSEGNWYSINSGTPNSFSTQHFGVSSDSIAPADYDGDGKTDVAVYRPSEGNWYIFNSSNSTVSTIHFGVTGDLAVPADYDGDGKSDIAIFRGGSQWWIQRSSDAGVYVINFGSVNDAPIRGDFTGDGKADIAIFRLGTWFILRSEDNSFYTNNLGAFGDIPVPADYDGDGKTDVAVYRPSEGNWYITNSGTGLTSTIPFGVAGDKPVAADYDGDGKADIAVFRPSSGTWYLNQSTAGVGIVNFGVSGDLATPNAFVR